MDQTKRARMSMATNEKLDLEKDGKPVSEKVYRGMIGSQLYLIASHLDIIISVVCVLGFRPLLKSPISHV